MEEGKRFEARQNECGLFTNTLHPEKSDLYGQIDVLCSHCGNAGGFWVSGWQKVTSAGSKYLKIKLRPKTPGRGPNDARVGDAELL
jgi:hypothetical protein